MFCSVYRDARMLTRAYSFFEIKSVDVDQRIITGTASTPETDRTSDQMSMEGVRFRLPLPFRFEHKTNIGNVIAANVTSAGIEITAQVASIDQPGRLKDELDYAWQSIKIGLVRGLSIGWRPIEGARNEFGGMAVKAWEWLETSAVTIPANAHATIATIKSMDGAALAASGRADAVRTSHPGDTGLTARTHAMAKSINDQIVEFTTARGPKADRMGVMMEKALAEGRVLNADETTEYDALAADVKSYDEHIGRLEALEAASRAKAAPIAMARPATSPPVHSVQVTDPLPKGIEFARMVICKAAAGRGNDVGALQIAQMRYPDNPRIHALLKTYIPGGTTMGDTWAGPLVYAQNLVTEFIEYLRPMTILGKFGTGNIPSLRRVPFNVRITGQTTGGAANWVGEGKGKPLTKFAFTAATLYWAKVAAISVISEELVRFSSPAAEGLVRDALAGALTERLDIDFIDPTKVAVANVSPASITYGVAPLTSAGDDAAAVRADLRQLFEAFIVAGISPTTGVFIMPQTIALGLSLMQNALGQPEFPGITMNGGTLFGLPVITSQYATFDSPGDNIVVLVNASDIFLSDDGGITVDVSREASLEMVDNPTMNEGSPTDPPTTELVNMFQTNSIAIRSERFINWAKRRADAVAWLEDVTWGTGTM